MAVVISLDAGWRMERCGVARGDGLVVGVGGRYLKETSSRG